MTNSNNLAQQEEAFFVYPNKPWAKNINAYFNVSDYIVLKVFKESSEESKEFIIDTDKFKIVSEFHWYYKRGGKGTKFYAQRSYGPKKDKKTMFLHRLVFGETNMHLDHINRESQDNRISNLRETTRTGNMVNVVLSAKRDLPMGVYHHQGKYRSFLNSDTQGRLEVGVFKTVQECHEAYKKAHVDRYKEFSPYYNEVQNVG